jgi:hypothetical protein
MQLLRAAARDPTVGELSDPTFVGTVFLPDNKAFQVPLGGTRST